MKIYRYVAVKRYEGVVIANDKITATECVLKKIGGAAFDNVYVHGATQEVQECRELVEEDTDI